MESTKGSYNAAVLKFILFSGIGAIMFFVNVDIGGVSVIPIQHIINLIKKTCGPVIPYFTLLMVMAGGIMPIVNGSYKTSKFNFVFTAIKLLGTVIGIMAVFQIGPESIMRADMVPFLFNSVVVPIALMIPVTGVAYVMLLNFGLVEFISAFMQPVMRKIWKTPGESAIDAVVSFSGGYALAVLLNRIDLLFNCHCQYPWIYGALDAVFLCLLFCNLLRDCCYGQDLSHSRYSQCLL